MKKFRAATADELAEWADSAHRNADRSDYDTPGSVRYCPCDSCNEARKIHGRPEKSKSLLKIKQIFDYDENGKLYVKYADPVWKERR